MKVNNFSYEKNLYTQGIRYIAGVDEVGRGPLAGPMVVSATILNIQTVIGLLEGHSINNDVVNLYTQINDSKLISEKKRNLLSEFIKKEAITYSIVEISNTEIDHMGIAQATQKAFYMAIKQLRTTPQHILTDMFAIKQINPNQQTNIKSGDKLSITIGAASILAKVYRDELMVKLHEKYTNYGFDQHKGYGTKYHLEMLKRFGPCDIHRKSFEPIKKMVP